MSDNNKKRNSVYVVMFIFLITKVFGFLKLRTIAQLFGATHELDIFWAAFTIPDILFTLVIAGSLNAAIIPVLSDIFHKKGDEALNKFFNQLSVVISYIIIILGLLLFIFTPQITDLIIDFSYIQDVLSFSQKITAEDFELFVSLTRIMMLSPILLGISTLISGYLQTRKQFFTTSLAPLFYNIAMAVMPYLFVGVFHMGVTGIALSAVFGSLLHLLIQIPTFKKYYTDKFRVGVDVFKEGIKNPQTKFALKLALPRTISLFCEQINVVINTIISFSLQSGALSAYKFAVSLHQFPINIIGSAVAQVALPNLAENCDKKATFRKVLNESIQFSIFLVLPIVGILLVLRLPLVRLAYGTGAFDWNDTLLTAWCLALLSLSVIGQTVVQILLRAFYALKETWLPLVGIVLGIIVNISLAYFMTNFFSHYYDWRPILEQMTIQVSNSEGSNFCQTLVSFITDFAKWSTNRGDSNMAVGGLAFSLSCAYFVEMLSLTWLLNKKIGIISWKSNVQPILKKLLNALLMVIGMYLVFKLFDFQLDTSRTISIIILVIITSVYGIVSYWIGAKVFGIKEVDLFEEKVVKVKNKLLKKKVNENS